MHFAFFKFLKKYARPEYRVPFGHDRVLEDLALRKHRDACRLTFKYDNARFSEIFLPPPPPPSRPVFFLYFKHAGIYNYIIHLYLLRSI